MNDDEFYWYLTSAWNLRVSRLIERIQDDEIDLKIEILK